MTGDLVDVTITEDAGHQGKRLLQKPFRISELISLLIGLVAPATELQPKK